jgi:thioredoxin 1
MSHKIATVSEADFTGTVLGGAGPCVVDFWATWCVPCQRIESILEEMAHAYEGKVSFFKVDVNESAGTASRYSVRSIPTLLFFQKGEVVDQAVGSISREDIEEKLVRLLAEA